jgi:cyanophycinase
MNGTLFLIGGHEDREGDREVLSVIARECHGGPLALITAASSDPASYVPIYRDAFGPLGVEIVELRLEDRDAADDPSNVALIDSAGGVFMSGGGQVRGAEVLRGSAVGRRIHERWESGMPVAGTSAGAALIGEWMLSSGGNDDSAPASLEVERGLGLLGGTLVDQHLSERGRLPRFISAASLQGVLGLGIDEDTAAVVRGSTVTAVGSGTLTVVGTAHATATRTDSGVSLRDVLVCVVTTDDEPYELPF